LLAAFGCLQNALVGGLVFGWASIDRTLLVAPTAQGGAGLQPMETTQIFSWASTVAMLSSLVMGYVLDVCGPRTASVLSNLCVGLGCAIFAMTAAADANHHPDPSTDTFSSSLSSPYYTRFAVATCLMAFGGPGIGSSIVHVANLFPNHPFLVMSCLGGSSTFSFSILALFGDLWEQYDLSLGTMFGTYVWIIVASALGSFWFLPDVPFCKEDSEEYTHFDDSDNRMAPVPVGESKSHEKEPLLSSMPATTKRQGHEPAAAIHKKPISAEQEYAEATIGHHHQLYEEPLASGLRQKLPFGRTESYFQSAQVMAMESGDGPTTAMYTTTTMISLKDQPFRNQLRSPTYVRNLIIFVTTSFFVNFTIASLSTELADEQVFSVEVQHDLSRNFTLIMSGGFMVSMFVGWLMDRVGLETCTIVTLILGQASLVLRMVAGTETYYNPVMMLMGFVVYTLFRQFLFPVFIASLTAKLGFKYFGILSGIGFALSGVAQVFMAMLVHGLAGDCHLHPPQEQKQQQHTSASSTETLPSCSHGSWLQFHLFQLILLCLLTVIPLQDRRGAARQKQRMESSTAKRQQTFESQESSFGSFGSDTRMESLPMEATCTGPAAVVLPTVP